MEQHNTTSKTTRDLIETVDERLRNAMSEIMVQTVNEIEVSYKKLYEKLNTTMNDVINETMNETLYETITDLLTRMRNELDAIYEEELYNKLDLSLDKKMRELD